MAFILNKKISYFGNMFLYWPHISKTKQKKKKTEHSDAKIPFKWIEFFVGSDLEKVTLAFKQHES